MAKSLGVRSPEKWYRLLTFADKSRRWVWEKQPEDMHICLFSHILFLLFPKPQPNQACLFSPLRFCDYLPSYPRSLFQCELTSGAWKNSFLPYNLQTHSDTLSSPHTAHISFLPSKVLSLLLNWKHLGNSNPLQYSCLGNPMVRGTWQVTVHGVTKSWTWLSD